MGFGLGFGLGSGLGSGSGVGSGAEARCAVPCLLEVGGDAIDADALDNGIVPAPQQGEGTLSMAVASSATAKWRSATASGATA